MFPWLGKHVNGIVVILVPFLISLSKQHNENSNSLSFLVYSYLFLASFILITIMVK